MSEPKCSAVSVSALSADEFVAVFEDGSIWSHSSRQRTTPNATGWKCLYESDRARNLAELEQDVKTTCASYGLYSSSSDPVPLFQLLKQELKRMGDSLASALGAKSK